MRFPLQRHRPGPIALDLGGSSIKILQLDGNRRSILAAVEEMVPKGLARDPDAYLSWLRNMLPCCIAASTCRGRRLIASLPCAWTTVQHLQLEAADASAADHVAPMMLPPMDDEPLTQVTRVGPVQRDGQHLTDFICISFPRRRVFQLVDLLHEHRFDLVDLRSLFGASTCAFDHIHENGDDSTSATLYVDLGADGVRAAVTQGRRLVQARHITDVAEYRERPAAAPLEPDVLETIVDELHMAIRHHAMVFPQGRIGRIIFLGGGAQSDHTCTYIVESLHLPGQRGDPLASLVRPVETTSPIHRGDGPRPGWSSVAGLAISSARARERHHAA